MGDLALVSEVEWQQQVVQLAAMMGWEHLHVRRSIGKQRSWVTATNIVGWPDLLLWSERQPGRHLAVELKSESGQLRPEQREVLNRLSAAGFHSYVWRPRDLETAKAVLSPRRA